MCHLSSEQSNFSCIHENVLGGKPMPINDFLIGLDHSPTLKLLIPHGKSVSMLHECVKITLNISICIVSW